MLGYKYMMHYAQHDPHLCCWVNVYQAHVSQPNIFDKMTFFDKGWVLVRGTFQWGNPAHLNGLQLSLFPKYLDVTPLVNSSFWSGCFPIIHAHEQMHSVSAARSAQLVVTVRQLTSESLVLNGMRTVAHLNS